MKQKPFKYLRRKAHLFFEAKEKEDKQTGENLIFDEVFLDDTKYVGKILADGNTVVLVGGTVEDKDATGEWEASQVLVIPGDGAEDQKVAVMQSGDKGNSETAFEDSKVKEFGELQKKIAKWSEFAVAEMKDGKLVPAASGRIVVSKDDNGDLRFDVASFGDGEKKDKKENKKEDKKEDKKDDDKKENVDESQGPVPADSIENGVVFVANPDLTDAAPPRNTAAFWNAARDLYNSEGYIDKYMIDDLFQYGDVFNGLSEKCKQEIKGISIPQTTYSTEYPGFNVIFAQDLDDGQLVPGKESAAEFREWLSR